MRLGSPTFKFFLTLVREFPEFVWDNARIERTHAGYWQRREGAWSWFVFGLKHKNGAHAEVGSQDPITKLLRAKHLVMFQEGIGASYTVADSRDANMNDPKVMLSESLKTA